LEEAPEHGDSEQFPCDLVPLVCGRLALDDAAADDRDGMDGMHHDFR